MKMVFKCLLMAGVVGSLAMGAELDKASAKAEFAAFKMANKVRVPGFFRDVEFNFAKTSGSVAEILSGASAKVDFNKIDTIKNPMRDKNIKDKLVAHLSTPEISVKFDEVKGDDKAGEVKASVSLNGTTKQIPMKYSVEDKKLTTIGTIKMTDFMTEAYDKFRLDKAISALHGKMTHDEVEIIFSADVK